MVDRFGGGVVITIIILALLTISIVVGWVIARRRRAAAMRNREEIPLFTIPASQLAGYGGRGLSAEDRLELDDHLAICERCRQRVSAVTDEVGGLLADQHAGCMGVAADDGRHHRSVRNP